MRDVGLAVLVTINLVVLVYFVLLNSVYLFTSMTAFRSLRRYTQRLKSVDVDEILRSGAALPVTVVAPAYNEEPTIVEVTQSLLTLEYPDYQVVIVNDGSKDRTLELLTETFELVPAPRAPSSDIETAPVRGTYRSTRHPNLLVVDKVNGGSKADAINAGLNFVRTPLFLIIDSDSLLESQALTRVSRPFLEDDRTIAAGGIVRIVNGSAVRSARVVDVRMPRNLLARFQVLEYLRAFHAGRVGWAALNATMIISGAFGLFRRSAVADVGGLNTDAIGEDIDLTIRLHRQCRENGQPYRIVYIPDPVVWTEGPEDLKSLAGQRKRWQRGLIQVLARNIRVLLNPRYGTMGTLAFPYYFFFEMLGPVVEVAGYVAFAATIILGLGSAPYILAFLALAIALGVALSVAAVGLEELTFCRYRRTSDLVGLFWLAIIENIGYRQLNSLWRIKGTFDYFRRAEGWGEMPRKGFATGD
jgi:cellulose synthase/poly-beta-1,6-N-acetylglucosamine synthase-like glycosyltransferase